MARFVRSRSLTGALVRTFRVRCLFFRYASRTYGRHGRLFFSVRFAFVRPARPLIPVAGYPATPCAAAPACRLRLGYVLGQNAALRAVGSPSSVSSIFLTILRASPKKLRTACILARFPWSCLKWYISGTCHVLSSWDTFVCVSIAHAWPRFPISSGM